MQKADRVELRVADLGPDVVTYTLETPVGTIVYVNTEERLAAMLPADERDRAG